MRRQNIVGISAVLVVVVIVLVVMVAVTIFLTLQGSPKEKETLVLDSTFSLPNATASYRSYYCLVPFYAKNPSLKGSFSSSSGLYMFVYNIANYSEYVLSGSRFDATPLYATGLVTSDSFDIAVPSGNTYYIVFQIVLNQTTTVTAKATLYYSD